MTHNEDIMKDILDAAQSMVDDNVTDARESLQDAINIIDIEYYGRERVD